MQTKSVMILLNDLQYWVNIKQDLNSSQKGEDYSDEDYEESDIIVVWESGVQPLTDVQRLIFLALTIIVTIIAIVGNILVIYVNFTRFVSCIFDEVFNHLGKFKLLKK